MASLFVVVFVIVVCSVLEIHSKEYQYGQKPVMEDLARFLETPLPEGGLMGNLTKIVEQGLVHALGLGTSKRSDGMSSSESWVPSIFKTMKYAFNYLGKSKEFGLGGFGGDGDNGLTGPVSLLALVVIAAFLLIFLQPMLGHPYKRRMSRRFRGSPSPYAYKSPPTYWTSSEGKHFSSTQSRPIILPGPALVPVAMPLTAQVPTIVEDSEGQHTQQTQKQVRRKRVRKNQQKTISGKLNSGDSEWDSTGGQSNSNDPEDKLTKEEILYILKTLDD